MPLLSLGKIMYIRPFEAQADTVNIAVTGSQTRLAINTTPIGNRSVRLVNSGSDVVYFKLGNSAVTVTTGNGVPLLPNTVEVFLLRNENSHIVAIAGAANSTLFITVGESA